MIWKTLETDVLSTAALRLPDKIEELREEQALLASGSDPRISFEGAAKIYLERLKASPDFKPRTKAYHAERLAAFFKSWPAVKTKPVKDITKAECIDWRNRFAAKYNPTNFNHTLGIIRAIFDIGIETGARRVYAALEKCDGWRSKSETPSGRTRTPFRWVRQAMGRRSEVKEAGGRLARRAKPAALLRSDPERARLCNRRYRRFRQGAARLATLYRPSKDQP